MEYWSIEKLIGVALFALLQHFITPILQSPITLFSSNENGEARASPRRFVLST
jgi:hypothetical protein